MVIEGVWASYMYRADEAVGDLITDERDECVAESVAVAVVMKDPHSYVDMAVHSLLMQLREPFRSA